MEEKLAAYRARKIKEKEAENSLVNRLRNSFSFKEKKCDPPSQCLPNTGNSSQRETADESHEQNDDSTDHPQSDLMYWTLTCLKFLLWLCVWGIFVELQFGAVYFTLSLIIFIYFNTGSVKKDKGLSAYSVFNKDCARIQGTLTAEQMQRDMFRVPGLPT